MPFSLLNVAFCLPIGSLPLPHFEDGPYAIVGTAAAANQPLGWFAADMDAIQQTRADRRMMGLSHPLALRNLGVMLTAELSAWAQEGNIVCNNRAKDLP